MQPFVDLGRVVLHIDPDLGYRGDVLGEQVQVHLPVLLKLRTRGSDLLDVVLQVLDLLLLIPFFVIEDYARDIRKNKYQDG